MVVKLCSTVIAHPWTSIADRLVVYLSIDRWIIKTRWTYHGNVFPLTTAEPSRRSYDRWSNRFGKSGWDSALLKKQNSSILCAFMYSLHNEYIYIYVLLLLRACCWLRLLPPIGGACFGIEEAHRQIERQAGRHTHLTHARTHLGTHTHEQIHIHEQIHTHTHTHTHTHILGGGGGGRMWGRMLSGVTLLEVKIHHSWWDLRTVSLQHSPLVRWNK